MKLIDILVQELPKRGGWPIDSDDERTLIATLPDICWGLDSGGYYAFRGPCDSVSHKLYEETLLALKSGWDGEGLPPVGCVCEVKGCIGHYLEWHKVTVFAVRGNTIFFDMEDGRWGQTDSHEFRPISSEADKKRDEAEKGIADALFKDGDFDWKESLRLATFVYGAISNSKIPHIRID